jgi:two-component system, sensor histidine kinase and response regulator
MSGPDEAKTMLDAGSDIGLDAATLADLRDESEELLLELIDLFAVEAPKQLLVLATSVATGDRGQAERAAHTLKSSAATLGAFAMRDRALAAENAARTGDLEAVAGMLDALRGAWKCAVDELIAEKERASRAMSPS